MLLGIAWRPFFRSLQFLQSGAVAARLAHNQKVGGAIPSSAPNFLRHLESALRR